MFVNDSRGGLGRLGFLPFQHHDYGQRYSLDMRASVWGCRILDHEIGEGELGHYVWDEGAVGDVIGAFHWPSSGAAGITGETSGRATGAWSWVYPALVNTQGGSGGPSGAVTPSTQTPTDGPAVIPEITPNPDGTTPTGGGLGPIYYAGGRIGYPTPITPAANWGAGGNGGAGGGAGGAGGAGGGGGAVPAIGGGNPIWAGAGFAGGAPDQGGAPGGGINVGIGGQAWAPWWAGVQADVGLPGNQPFFGFFGPPMGIQTQGFWADTPQATGGLFGVGLPQSFPVFLPGFLPGVKPRPKSKTPTQTAFWISDLGDIDEEDRPAQSLVPIRDENWEGDGRFSPVASQPPQEWPVLPRGMAGVVVQTTEESRQVVQFHPTDPRLVSPQLYGDPRAGSIVEEPNEDGELDGSRQAHLQSMMRVVVDPQGIGKKGESTISWNIGKTPRRDAQGGLVTDVMGHGHMGVQGGGPLLTGNSKCSHIIGKDADDVTIRSGHLAISSLFTDADGSRDAPLEFETIYEDGGDLDFPIRVHLGHDQNSRHGWLGGDRPGLWRWWTTSYFETTPPTIDDETPPPTTPPPSIPVPTPPNGTPTGGGTTVYDLLAQDPHAQEGYVHSAGIIAGPGTLAKPQRAQAGAGDVRGAASMSPDALREYRTLTPLTGRIEAFGAQGGTPGGPYFEDPPDPAGWEYTYRPGEGRSPTGTAPGGWVILPPEVGLESVDEDFAPAAVSTSPVAFLAGPGAVIGCGTPELATGGVASGATFEAADEDLTLRRYDNVGEQTSSVRLLDMAEIKTLAGLDFTPGDLNDVTETGDQKQIGVRVDSGNESIQINIGGTIFTVALA